MFIEIVGNLRLFKKLEESRQLARDRDVTLEGYNVLKIGHVNKTLELLEYNHEMQYALPVQWEDGEQILSHYVLLNDLFSIGFEPVTLPDAEQF